ncbi:MAG: hypothetical protein Q8O90_05110, partial [Elusimicrobiota bacterium]|nr:hypothetical protein [Elusimicrobiota bacterium]
NQFVRQNSAGGVFTVSVIADADVPDSIAINGTNNVTWASVNKTGSSLADLATRSASDLATGTLALARGGTGASLSATGGANQFVRQNSAGGVFTVSVIADADVPDSITLTDITQVTNRAITDMSGTLTVGNGGTGSTTAGGARTNLGLGSGLSATYTVVVDTFPYTCSDFTYTNGILITVGAGVCP